MTFYNAGPNQVYGMRPAEGSPKPQQQPVDNGQQNENEIETPCFNKPSVRLTNVAQQVTPFLYSRQVAS